MHNFVPMILVQYRRTGFQALKSKLYSLPAPAAPSPGHTSLALKAIEEALRIAISCDQHLENKY